jgi:hypothetical protein
MNDSQKTFVGSAHRMIFWIEKGIAAVVLIGVLAFLVTSVWHFLSLDWTSMDTYYDLIYRSLLIIIGLELVRMLVTHSVAAVLELLAFVIARKMLKPDLTSLDIILSVAAFVLLMAARHYFRESCFDVEEEENFRKTA